MAQAIRAADGWIGFADFMQLALYTPGLGYYANDLRKLGLMPGSGSDFVTAPELTSLFGQALAVQVAQAFQETRTDQIYEFGAGSGALALHLLDALERLGEHVRTYNIIDVSGALRARQQQTLQKFGSRIQWLNEWPQEMRGVVVGNEVLDAMPVQMLVRKRGVWHERGVSLAPDGEERFVWADLPTELRPPAELDFEYDYVTEIHPQAEAFVRSLASRLQQGAAFFIDYGFPEHEYYHPQRHMGTVMCHRAHKSDADPLADVGLKDITAHVNFTGIGLAAQEAGLIVLGYTSQARFLINCGLGRLMEDASMVERSKGHKLLAEHEMGELFKVIGLTAGDPWQALGFAEGDRTHTL